jgi:hypothetical protein
VLGDHRKIAEGIDDRDVIPLPRPLIEGKAGT